MNDDDFRARVLAIARASGNGIKPLSVDYICNELRKVLDDDAAVAAIRHELRKLKSAKPTQFWTAEQALEYANSTAMQRLEAANATTAEEREIKRQIAEQAKPKVTLSDRELALPPEVRMALFDERMAALLLAQKARKS